MLGIFGGTVQIMIRMKTEIFTVVCVQSMKGGVVFVCTVCTLMALAARVRRKVKNLWLLLTECDEVHGWYTSYHCWQTV